MKYELNVEAREFLTHVPKLDLEGFEKWVDSLVLQIGSNNVLQYIAEKKRWNTTCAARTTLKCDFSHQAKTLIKHMDDFDEVECRAWFGNALELTKGDLQAYIEQVR
jgi:hypothetical protein